MRINSKILAWILGISPPAVCQLHKRGKITPVCKTGRCVLFEIPDVLLEYDENINHGISLANQANKLDNWAQRKKAQKSPVIEQGHAGVTKLLH
jgi:hypothetical protein